MSHRDFPGAKWWKFDFHTHTRASDDFLKGCTQEVKEKVTPEYWLRKFMQKGIDCVAITDHNSGEWIDVLKLELAEMKESQSEGYRPLVLFPGVEISANYGVHILAIFGPDKCKNDIDSLLDAIEYGGTKGKSDGVTTKSVINVLNVIAQRGAIAIPAHVDKRNGLFEQSHVPTLEQVLDKGNIYAMEVVEDSYQEPQPYKERQLQWTKVRGSDTHNFRDTSFGDFTWVKMDEPTIEGLRLALRDGAASVNRKMNDNPNRHAEWVIEELIVDKAKYIGRSKPLHCRFSPFLNSAIGGRGSGKSTLLEFMRLVLRREQDMPNRLKEENDRYFDPKSNDALLVSNSQLSLICRKGDVRYRLNWSTKMDTPSLEEKKDGAWESVPGEIKSLFPAYIYSQKEIFELAREPSALLNIIDEAPEVGDAAYKEQERTLKSGYKQIEQKIQELDQKIAQENRLRGESNDLARQIEQIEKSGHKEILQEYRKRQQQKTEIRGLEDEWQAMRCQLAEMQDAITPAQFNADHFDGHSDMLSALKATNQKWQALSDKLNSLVVEAQTIINDWEAERDEAAWMQTLTKDIDRYEQVRSQLTQQGIDPDKYPSLLEQQRSLQDELQKMDGYRVRKRELVTERKKTFERLAEHRKNLSTKRQKFLTCVLESNQSVSIEVRPFGENWDGVEEAIRHILHCGDSYVRDFEHLRDIYHNGGDEKIETLKRRIEKLRNGEETPRDGRFRTRLKSLTPESVSDFNLWFPADDLRITFGPKNQPIEQGSPGQKTAALLAFILSYGSEPLLLDQPEDDLDNELIYDLIVQQLRDTKSRRQIIVVTHNANIVVNGDAEMVLPLKVTGGETHVQNPASIQNKQVRQAICDILEGGHKAFEQRYRRIHLES